MSTDNQNHMNLGNARHEEQAKVMQDVGGNGNCPFCPEQLAMCHKQEILCENDYWLLTYNQWPYDNTDLHLMAISKKHINSLIEMEPGSAEALFDLMKYAEMRFDIDHGAICMRFGDINYTGATIGHLHVHLIVSTKNLPEGAKVKFKVGDKPK